MLYITSYILISPPSLPIKYVYSLRLSRGTAHAPLATGRTLLCLPYPPRTSSSPIAVALPPLTPLIPPVTPYPYIHTSPPLAQLSPCFPGTNPTAIYIGSSMYSPKTGFSAVSSHILPLPLPYTTLLYSGVYFVSFALVLSMIPYSC